MKPMAVSLGVRRIVSHATCLHTQAAPGQTNQLDRSDESVAPNRFGRLLCHLLGRRLARRRDAIAQRQVAHTHSHVTGPLGAIVSTGSGGAV